MSALGAHVFAAVDPATRSGSLDLQALLDEADRSNPEILAALARSSAAGQASSQAEALPDPLVAVSFTNVGLSSITLGDDENANLMFIWTQDLPGYGKRRLAGDVARADAAVADLSVDLVRLRVAAKVKSLYAEIHRIDQTRIVLNESAGLLDSFVDTTRVRYETGEGILESVLKASTERTRLEAERAILDQERTSTEIELLAVVGDSREGPLPSAREPAVGLVLDSAELEAAALEQSPELHVLRAVTQRESARLEQARKNLRPDYSWGAAYGYRGDLDPMVQGMFGVRLPLSREAKQGAAAAQVEHERQAALRDVELSERKVRAQVRDLVARARRAETLAQLYDAGILPQARSALDAASAAYAVGRTDFMTLLDDFLKMLRYEIESETQKAERVKFLAALEPLTGEVLVVP